MSKKLASTLGGIMFIVACTGAALAMPAAFTDEDTSALAELGQEELQELDTTAVVSEGETTDVTVPIPTPTPTDDAEGDEEGAGDGTENHGKAVSTAAHCAIKGRAHGELVRSVAQDKNATVASAQAACDAALAAAAAAPASVKPAKAPKQAKAAKPVNAAKPVKAPKPAKVTAPVVSDTDETSESTTGSVPPGHGGPPPGKGNPHKP